MSTIAEAKNMRSKIDVTGKVIHKGEPRSVNMKSGGSIDVCECMLADDTGEMKLTLWGEDVQQVNEGDKVELQNAYTTIFKEETSLTKGKFGQMTVTPS